MQGQSIICTLLFVVFFGIGAASLSGSILCDDLVRYYRNRQLLETARESLHRLESLNADYDALLDQLDKDPNLVKRIAPAAIGVEPEDANAVHPAATPEQLAAARKALTEEPSPRPVDSMVPQWLSRCSEPRRRVALSLAGAGLILVSFMCFAPVKRLKTQG
jgi:hypothetical protein